LCPSPSRAAHSSAHAQRLRATCGRLAEGIAAVTTQLFNLFNQVFGQFLAGARRRARQLSRLLAWQPSWHLPRPSWLSWCPSLSRLHRLVLGLALVDAAVIGWRADLVWIMPQTAAFYARLGLPVNLRGIDFDRLAVTAERHDGEPVLIVNVEVGDSTGRIEAVPHLRFAIRDAQRQEIYSWTAAPARPRLGAGGRLALRSEVILPPPDTREVVVRFVDPDSTL
jgi:hypothetical protein